MTSNLGPPHSSLDGKPTESYEVIANRAQHVWEKVISLIGHFGLDPNRALDVILDVLSVHIATHYTFFLALLSFTPWAGGFRPPKSNAFESTSSNPHLYRGANLDKILEFAENLAGYKKDETPSAHASAVSTPDVLAQILGFKFRHYQVCLRYPYYNGPTLIKSSGRRYPRGYTTRIILDRSYFDPGRFHCFGGPITTRPFYLTSSES